MAKHKVNADWFKDYVVTHDLASAVGLGENKRLQVEITIPALTANYRVMVWGEAEYYGPDFSEAVKAYNAAQAGDRE